MSFTDQCPMCKHYNYGMLFKCAAFPEGIPEPILTGEFDHTIRFPRQKNDITFEHMDGIERITIDSEFQIPVYSEVCSRCRHLTDGHKRRCKAFPGEIPYDIWMAKDPHIEKHPDQENDIVFLNIFR